MYDDGYFAVPNIGAYSQVEWQAAPTAAVTSASGMTGCCTISRAMSRLPSRSRKEYSINSRPNFRRVESQAGDVVLRVSWARLRGSRHRRVIAESRCAVAESLYPKSLWNYEVGARRILGDRVRLDGSVFYADVRGEFVPRTVNNVSRPENASRSRNIGVELGATARASAHSSFCGGYTFLDLRLRDYTSAVLGSDGTLSRGRFRRQAPSGGASSSTHWRGSHRSRLPAFDLGKSRSSGRVSSTSRPETPMKVSGISGHSRTRPCSRCRFARYQRAPSFTSTPRGDWVRRRCSAASRIFSDASMQATFWRTRASGVSTKRDRQHRSRSGSRLTGWATCFKA